MTKAQVEKILRVATENDWKELGLFFLGVTIGAEPEVTPATLKAISSKISKVKAKAVAKKIASPRRKRGQISELLLKALPHSATEALTLNALARRARVRNPVSVNGPLKKLIKSTVVEVTGAGGRGDPFRYYKTTESNGTAVQ